MIAAADVVSISVVPYTVLPFLLFLVWGSRPYLWWGAAVVISSWLTFVAKEGGKRMFGSCEWCRRPRGASNCNTWMNDGNQGGAPGFPSGHMAVTAAFWMGAWLLAGKSERLILGAGLIATAAMAWARIHKRCHSWIQVSGGGMLGALVAFTMFSYNRS